MGMPKASPADVGSSVVDAIEDNRAQAITAPLALRIGAVFGRSMPATIVRLAPRFGASELIGSIAEPLKH